MLISFPDGPKFEAIEEVDLRKNHEFIYDNPPIDGHGTNVKNDGKLMMHYHELFKRYKEDIEYIVEKFKEVVREYIYIKTVNGEFWIELSCMKKGTSYSPFLLFDHRTHGASISLSITNP